MRILVTGSEGQLGHDVVVELKSRGHVVIETDIVDRDKSNYFRMDITKQDEVLSSVQKINPDLIVHCAAWTRVDDAEDNAVLVDTINHLGAMYVAEAARAVDAKMIYISTDYVFDGTGSEPWKPDDKNYAPINVYGQSKLDGELAVSSILDKYFIVRIAWLFGMKGNNFVTGMIRAGVNHEFVRVVNDQIGTPTYTRDLAVFLADLAVTDKYGYYHATNEGGYISWCEFCMRIYKRAKIDTKVIPVTTEEYGLSKAKRPYNSRLDKSKIVDMGFNPLPSWWDALDRYLKELGLM